VRDLKPADFVVRDAGELRDIASLTFGTNPLDIVLFTDGSRAEQLQTAARRAVAQLQPQDRVALIVFGEKLVLSLGLALNRDILLSAIQKIQPPLAANDLDRAIAPVACYGQSQYVGAITAKLKRERKPHETHNCNVCGFSGHLGRASVRLDTYRLRS
jgi:hypothetical protein